MSHQITTEELIKYIQAKTWVVGASSFGKGSQKKLEVSNEGELRVTDHDEVTYHGRLISEAVRAYNAAP
jgi:hydroxyacyl-ACP dehydratase HTD2-like protein with hotdog domain